MATVDRTGDRSLARRDGRGRSRLADAVGGRLPHLPSGKAERSCGRTVGIFCTNWAYIFAGSMYSIDLGTCEYIY